MQTIQVSKLLKNVLIADAIGGVASAALHLVGGAALASMLALPQSLLTGSGIFLAGYAVVLFALALRRTLPKAVIWAVIGGNVAWSLIAVDIALMGVVSPNAMGLAYLAVQALAVLGLAVVEYVGLKASPMVRETRTAGVLA